MLVTMQVQIHYSGKICAKAELVDVCLAHLVDSSKMRQSLYA